MKKRIFVEKRGLFDVESPKVMDEIKSIDSSITGVKVYNIYDIFGIEPSQYEKALYSTFVDPVMDQLHEENPAQAHYFAMEYLPGQYDQRADSAQQCIALLTGNTTAQVRSGKLIEVLGASKAVVEEVAKSLINKVESQEKDLQILEIPTQSTPQPVLYHEGFTTWGPSELEAFYYQEAFSFGLDDLHHIQSYFISEKRDPSQTELKMLDTYWSDHCRHTTFETELTDIEFQGPYKEVLERIFTHYKQTRRALGREHRSISLMDIGTLAAKYLYQNAQLSNLVISEEINACTVEIEAEYDGRKEPWYLLFKNETHNHPTEIEPFGGASTCLGGAIRDPLSGRSYVYQAMRLSGAANVLEPLDQTLKGKLPQRTISKQAANGYSSYGNQIGLATTQVSEIYHPGYKAKRMEVGFVVGAVPQDWVRRETPVPGDKVIVLGGATGRDGVGGATGSSKEQDETSIHTLSTEVQKGNAVEERKIQRLFRNPEVTKLIKKSNDFGAGGVSVAIGEIAQSLEINLDTMPLKYEGLNGTELAISESQERMAVVVSAGQEKKFIELCAKENIHAFTIAEITDTGRLRMYWRGEKIVDLSREFLDTNGCKKVQAAKVTHLKPVQSISKSFSMTALKEELKQLNTASQKGLSEMFDSSVGATTVAMPFGGTFQQTPMEGSVQTLPVLGARDIETVSLASWGFDPYLSEQNSLLGASYAVVESVAKVVAMGGERKNIRLSFQEYFEKLGTDSSKWGKPLSSLLGAFDAQMQLGLAAIGGKDSMSGTYQDLTVPPTLISFACAHGRKSHIISPELKSPGNTLYFYHHKAQTDAMPNYEELKEVYDLVHKAIAEGSIVAAKTIKDGGLACALSVMSFGNKLGAKVTAQEQVLFEKNIGSLVLEAQSEIDHPLLKKIGTVCSSSLLEINGEVMEIDDLLTAYTSTFEELFPTKEKTRVILEPPAGKATGLQVVIKKHGFGTPQVFAPIFPGTNCEYETQNAFAQEGARVVSSPLVNLSAQHLNESIATWVEHIERSQIVVFSGGFSAGDEPDGSAKFIVNVLKNDRMQDAIAALLERDGMILGICNGFQALVKSGLLPYGRIRDLDQDSPTLAHNAIGRHISQMVHVKVLNDQSPWLTGDKGKVFTVPISHGEGRFVASESVLASLFEAGQVATQYVDLEGQVAHGMPFNPNNSLMGIEGVTSRDGKIYGRMSHPERVAKGLMRNIPGADYHNIFRNGVLYFKG